MPVLSAPCTQIRSSISDLLQEEAGMLAFSFFIEEPSTKTPAYNLYKSCNQWITVGYFTPLPDFFRFRFSHKNLVCLYFLRCTLFLLTHSQLS